jgi:hypothetical protein
MMGRLLSYSFSLDEAVPDDQIGAEPENPCLNAGQPHPSAALANRRSTISSGGITLSSCRNVDVMCSSRHTH